MKEVVPILYLGIEKDRDITQSYTVSRSTKVEEPEFAFNSG